MSETGHVQADHDKTMLRRFWQLHRHLSTIWIFEMNAENQRSRKERAPRLSPGARQAQLRAITLELLAEHGLGHTNHTMIAKRAGVSLPTMMHYYADHDDLVRDVLNEVANFLLHGIATRAAAEQVDPLAALEEMLVSLARSIDTHQDVVRTWLDWSTATRHPTWPRYIAFREAACAVVGKKLKEGKADGTISKDLVVEEAAEVVVGLAHMIAQMRFTGSTVAQTRLAIQHLLTGYLGGKPR
ncbi:TetR/AcrR family transcriptional regulator [Sphingobium sp. 15-1]|uniref:TetR/AcrR family transcriptional regulator n=2 Tax=unclassified Sphingobium TaxID=2611147 RepID=UPI001C3F965B|nr:TetR/AcrR family transcriptional regulator [Sphingobium sp. 15-1]